MLNKFEFEFEDTSSDGSITYEYSADASEKMSVIVENGVPVVYANRQAFLVLAKICAQVAVGQYLDGFHAHLYKDFDVDMPEAIRLVLNE